MSGNIRYFVIGLMVVVGSFAAVRTIAASPEVVLEDPPIAMSATKRVELEDASLAETIRRFSTLARLVKHEIAR